MNWFKKLFQSNVLEKEVQSNVQLKDESKIKPTHSLSISSKSFFSGIDINFINFIYFNDEVEKTTFISNIELLLNKLNISEDTDVVTGKQKITDYVSDLEDRIPFLNEVLNFNLEVTYNTINENGKETIIKTHKSITDSINKLDNYYSALNLCSYNLQKKSNNNFTDIKFEEDLISKTLEKSSLFNFARINTLFALGLNYFKTNRIQDMDNVFDKIRKENYELSTSTIADYYRKIGEIYIETKENNKALDWLKAGVLLNSKLGVKKLIDKLENN